MSFGDSSKECLNLWLYLNLIKHLPNFQRFLNRLKQKDHFHSTLFEVVVLGDYCNNGHKMIIQDEENSKSKTADFLVIDSNQTIHIECKSLKSTSRKEQVFWDDLYSRILSLFEKMNLGWNIEIYCEKELTAEDVKEIYRVIKKSAIERDLAESIISNGHVIIRKNEISDETIEKLKEMLSISTDASGESGTYFFDEAALAKFSSDKMNLSDGSAKKGGSLLITPFKIETGGVPVFLSPHRVGIYPHYNFDLSERIISVIKAASKQVPHDEIGIIHVEIPKDITSNFFNVIDKCYEKIQETLSNNHGRINAVVLYGSYYEKNDQSLGVSLNYTIPNFFPNKLTNPPFKTLGTTDIIEDFPGNEGTFALQCAIDPSWDPLSIQLLKNLSSPDGLKRLSIYISEGNKFRIELATSETGRVVMTFSKPVSIPRGEPIIIACSWERKDLQLRIFSSQQEKIYDEVGTYHIKGSESH